MSAAVPTAAAPPTASAPLLRVRDLRVLLSDAGEERPLVHRVSFDVNHNQTVALVGESGSGKSLTALAIMGLTPPGTRVRVSELRIADTDLGAMRERQLGEVRGRRIAMVFQNPMVALNPVLTVGRQFVQVLRRHEPGLSRHDARERAIELLMEVGISAPERRFTQYPFEMSGGMLQRAMIAIALAGKPELLIADEPTTALDTTLQAQIMELLRERQHEMGMALVLISHDLGVVAAHAEEVVVMYAGRVVERADVRTLFAHNAHPYTAALLKTVRDISSPTTRDLAPIPGTPPRLDRLPAGCPFAPRCAVVMDRCHVEDPALREVASGHLAACHRNEM
ncbi:MAG: ABC transporter ATP-binding protein [Solirubrobacteraceae bacterium]